MGSPYRGGSGSAGPAEPREEGLVDELIKQFADPLAFYRELVQNSIDADATSIAITVSYDDDPADPERGLLVASVRDDGVGMGRDTLENKLTVLFRSGKEGVEGKIGKFGVGFVSVLAIGPELVSVRTSQGDGDEWTLALSPDQTYELFRAPGGPSKGTTVSLHVRLPPGELEDFVARTERALVKWCRHVEIPVRFVALRGGEVLREGRIDRPFAAEGLVVVSQEQDPTQVSVALPRDGEPYLGFFKRGLLLHETAQDLFGVVSVKIQDPGLEHTLSRDNVRRDERYHRALAFARKVIEKDLMRAVQGAIEQAAKSERARYAELLAAVERSKLEAEIAIPLLETRGGASAVPASSVGARAWAATEASPLTVAAARAGAVVIDASFCKPRERALSMLSGALGRDLAPIERELTLLEPVAALDSDLALIDFVGRILSRVARAPSSIVLAKVSGALKDRAHLACGDALPAVVERAEALVDPFRLVARPALVLNAGDELIAAARTRAESEPRYAASILARSILLDRGRLTEEAWLAEASALAGEGP